jgi:hypothetical protein
MALELTEPLRKLSTRNSPEGEGRLSAVSTYCWQSKRHLCTHCLENVGSSISHYPRGLHGLLQGLALPFTYTHSDYMLRQMLMWRSRVFGCSEWMIRDRHIKCCSARHLPQVSCRADFGSWRWSSCVHPKHSFTYGLHEATIPEGGNIHNYCYEVLISYMGICIFTALRILISCLVFSIVQNRRYLLNH